MLLPLATCSPPFVVFRKTRSPLMIDHIVTSPAISRRARSLRACSGGPRWPEAGPRHLPAPPLQRGDRLIVPFLTFLTVDLQEALSDGHLGHPTPYHPLFVFNQDGDYVTAKLRPGNVPSAKGWDEVLLPVIDRYQTQGQTVVVRADAAFALPAFYGPDCDSGCSRPGSAWYGALGAIGSNWPRAT